MTGKNPRVPCVSPGFEGFRAKTRTQWKGVCPPVSLECPPRVPVCPRTRETRCVPVSPPLGGPGTRDTDSPTNRREHREERTTPYSAEP